MASLSPFLQNEVVPVSPVAGSSHETYRLRVENARYGRIEVSLDGGANYLLLGRVSHPAKSAAPDRSATRVGLVLRGSIEGFAFAVAPGFAIKIMPAPPASSNLRGTTARSGSGGGSSAEIVTSILPERGLFGKLLPPAGCKVLFQAPSHTPGPFPEGYSASQTDAFVVIAEIPTSAAAFGPPQQADTTSDADKNARIAFEHGVRALFESIALQYRESAIPRAITEKRKVVAGTLTLRPNLPPDEPDPITAVTYAIDDNVVCARTTAPYLFGWDTTSVTDEEHVVEVRGLSANGSVITRVRYLVVINNHKTSP